MLLEMLALADQHQLFCFCACPVDHHARIPGRPLLLTSAQASLPARWHLGSGAAPVQKRRRGTSGREGDGLTGVGEEEGGRRRISAEEKRGSAGRKEGE